jgi:hypothetical protein
MRCDLARDQRLSEAEVGREPDQSRRREPEAVGDEGAVGSRVEPHEDEVVALRDDVLVDLLRALGRDQHVDPELASLTGDPDRVLGGERGQRVARHGRAHVVRLVEHSQNRPALQPAVPQASQHGLGDQRLLVARGQRAEVHHQAAHVGVVERAEHRAGVLARPDPPVLDAEVAHAQVQTARLGTVDAGELGEALRPFLSEGRGEFGVLLAVGDRVEPQQRPLGRWIELGEPQSQSRVAGGGRRPHGDPASQRLPSLRGRRVGAVAHLGQAREVRVGVEDHDAQVRLEQHLLEHQPERVALSRPGLAAQERVAVEPAGVQAERRVVDERQVADREPRAARRGGLEPRPHLRRGGGARETVVEGRRFTVEEDPVPARDPDAQPGAELDVVGLLGRVADLPEVDLGQRERAHLAERCLAVALEHRVASEPQRETVDTGLEGEPAPIDRRGQREHGRLGLRPQRTEGVHALSETTHGPTSLTRSRFPLKGACLPPEPFTREG